LDLSVLLGDTPSPKKAAVTPKQKEEKVLIHLVFGIRATILGPVLFFKSFVEKFLFFYSEYC
jgi:hypothetical protein